MSERAAVPEWERLIRVRFRKGCVENRLLEDGDRILVAVSGGKDSLLLCRMIAERIPIHRPKIHVEAAHVIMDNVPYSTDLEWLQSYCASLGIPLHVIHQRWEERADNRKPPCFLCSWHRRHALFDFAVEHGFNKLALGHHQDDFLITWIMNSIYEGNASTMRPSMPMQHYPLTVIRPLCLVPEPFIVEAAKNLCFPPQKKSCPFEKETRRTDVQQLFQQMLDLSPDARHSLWRAAMGK